MALSHVLLITPLLDASHLPSSHYLSPVELSENKDENKNLAILNCKLDGGEHSSIVATDNEEDDISNAMEVCGS